VSFKTLVHWEQDFLLEPCLKISASGLVRLTQFYHSCMPFKTILQKTFLIKRWFCHHVALIQSLLKSTVVARTLALIFCCSLLWSCRSLQSLSENKKQLLVPEGPHLTPAQPDDITLTPFSLFSACHKCPPSCWEQ